MADTTIPQQQYAAPAVTVKDETEQYIQHTPTWMVVVRGVQVFFGFVILIMAGYLIHGNALGANAFALVCVGLPHDVTSVEPLSSRIANTRLAGLVHLVGRHLSACLGEGGVMPPGIQHLGCSGTRLPDGPLLAGLARCERRSPCQL